MNLVKFYLASLRSTAIARDLGISVTSNLFISFSRSLSPKYLLIPAQFLKDYKLKLKIRLICCLPFRHHKSSKQKRRESRRLEQEVWKTTVKDYEKALQY